MESAAPEEDGKRVAARKPATTPPASRRLRNADTKMRVANDDMGVLHITRNPGPELTNGQHRSKYLTLIPKSRAQVTCPSRVPKSRQALPPCPAESRPPSPFRFARPVAQEALTVGPVVGLDLPRRCSARQRDPISEIRFGRARHVGGLSRVPLHVLGTNHFRKAVRIEHIGHACRPRRRENAFVLDRELELQVLGFNV